MFVGLGIPSYQTWYCALCFSGGGAAEGCYCLEEDSARGKGADRRRARDTGHWTRQCLTVSLCLEATAMQPTLTLKS